MIKIKSLNEMLDLVAAKGGKIDCIVPGLLRRHMLEREMPIEKIKCAATRHGDHIIAGENHGECLRIAKAARFERADHRMGQGFLTTCMRFVLRREALEIAEEHGQIGTKHQPLNVLLSEDLI